MSAKLGDVPAPIRHAATDLLRAVMASDYTGLSVVIDKTGPGDIVKVDITTRTVAPSQPITITIAKELPR